MADGALSLLARLTEGRLSLPSVSLLTAARLVCLGAGLMLLSLLVYVLMAASAAVLRARQRQRMLLSLLAHGDPKVPGRWSWTTRPRRPTACPGCARPS